MRLQGIQIYCTAKCMKRHFSTDPVLYSAMCPMACCCLCLYMDEQIYVIHSPCIIGLQKHNSNDTCTNVYWTYLIHTLYG